MGTDTKIQRLTPAGCAGAIIFSWTDEWYRAGAEVDDWAFGLADRQRRPKRALRAVQTGRVQNYGLVLFGGLALIAVVLVIVPLVKA